MQVNDKDYLKYRESNMKKTYEIILFDLDGTLTDSKIGITNAIMYALKKYNIEVKERSELYKCIGPPLSYSFSTFFNFSREQTEEAVAYYREYYGDKGVFENRVYDGIEKLLKELKASGKKICLATSKPEQYAKMILEHFNLDKYFDFIGGASMDGKIGSKTEVIRYVIKEYGIEDKSKAIMVGDRKHDIMGAKDTGLDSIGVLFGYGSKAELLEAGATYIADNVEEIIKICK